MLIHEFKIGDRLFRVFTYNWTAIETIDEQTEVPVRSMLYLNLAVISADSWTMGGTRRRYSLSYKADLSPVHNSDRLRMKDEEVKVLDIWVGQNGLALVKWIKRCPFSVGRGSVVEKSADTPPPGSAIGPRGARRHR